MITKHVYFRQHEFDIFEHDDRPVIAAEKNCDNK
jgi:hypothetical protein